MAFPVEEAGVLMSSLHFHPLVHPFSLQMKGWQGGYKRGEPVHILDEASPCRFHGHPSTGICAGSVTVAKTGLLSGRKAACYPVDVQIDELKANHVEYVEQHVVAHDDIITGDGPDGAREFGESLAAALR